MKKEKVEENISNENLTPVLLDEKEEEENKVLNNNLVIETSSYYVFNDTILERNYKMINAINSVNQTVQPTANVIFSGTNVQTNACNSCCGWLSHNNNSGIFTLTKPGIYRVHFNANVAPTVAGAITLNITNAGENIAGGEMKTAGTTVGTFENVAAEVLVRVPCNSSVVLTIKDNTATNPITVSQPSLTITREA